MTVRKKMLEIVTIQKKAIRVTCNRCGNIWLYTGNKTNYVSCSKCRTTITFNKKSNSNSALREAL